MESMTSLLTQEQWDILDGMRSNLGLAADLAQAKIRANEKRKQEETFAF